MNTVNSSWRIVSGQTVILITLRLVVFFYFRSVPFQLFQYYSCFIDVVEINVCNSSECNGRLALTLFSDTFYLVVRKHLFYSAYILLPFISPPKTPYEVILGRGVARIFQRGVTVCQNEGTHQIVMSFSPPVVGCLLKKAHKRGGHRHPRTPLATPLILAQGFNVGFYGISPLKVCRN